MLGVVHLLTYNEQNGHIDLTVGGMLFVGLILLIVLSMAKD